jgi:hypothetical protein
LAAFFARASVDAVIATGMAADMAEGMALHVANGAATEAPMACADEIATYMWHLPQICARCGCLIKLATLAGSAQRIYCAARDFFS